MSDPLDAATPVPRSRRGRRWLALLAFGVVAVSGALLIREFYFSHPLGTGPAGPHVNPSGFQRPWTQ